MYRAFQDENVGVTRQFRPLKKHDCDDHQLSLD